MGMDGWVAKDPEQFVRIAQAASAQPEALKKRRARMRHDYKNSALNDGAGLAREMEIAYQSMWQKHCNKFSTKSTN
jgi:predicted O-linked N-acetylglucosamine transferase (SPINDLY family)